MAAIASVDALMETVQEVQARLSRLRLWQQHARTPGEREHVRAWADGVEYRLQGMVQQEEIVLERSAV